MKSFLLLSFYQPKTTAFFRQAVKCDRVVNNSIFSGETTMSYKKMDENKAEYLSRVHRVIDYIEEHLTSKLTLDELAAAGLIENGGKAGNGSSIMRAAGILGELSIREKNAMEALLSC
jgi:midasin (ATPase involved in ribosome maturation)